MSTIIDFKKAGEALGKSWTGLYLLVGCPFRETARAILWALQIGKNKTISDGLSLLGIPILLFGPLVLAFMLHFYWLLLSPFVIVVLGYGPLDGFGERFHGDPLAPGGKLSDKNADGTPKEIPKEDLKAKLTKEVRRLIAELEKENTKNANKSKSLVDKLAKKTKDKDKENIKKQIRKENDRHTKKSAELLDKIEKTKNALAAVIV